MNIFKRLTPSNDQGRAAKIKNIAMNVGIFVTFFAGISLWQTRSLLSVDEPAPDFSAPTLQGPVVSLDSLQGRSVLLYFFAPWCTVCRHSARNIVDLQNRIGKNKIQVIAVALDFESPAEVEDFVRETKISEIPVVLGNEAIRDLCHIQAYPSAYGLDANSHVRFRSVGYSTFLGLLMRTAIYL